jgi:hypothetical protein
MNAATGAGPPHSLGKRFTIDQLIDPKINTATIIMEARKFPAFTTAATTAAAVDAFVRFVERPLNTTSAITKRIAIADPLT